MHTIKEILLVYGRIVTILPLLLAATLFMGKRSIGELPVFDFLVIITLGAVVGADIADPKIEHIHTAMTVIGIAVLQRLISNLVIKYRKFGKALTFEPTIVIKDGIFMVENLRNIHYSLDNVLQMLREKDIFDVSVVQLGLIEPNGRLSVFKKSDYSTVTRRNLKLEGKHDKLTYPIIIEGKIDSSTLEHLNKNESWLMKELKNRGIEQVEDVFYATLNSDLKLHLSPKNHSAPTFLKH
ncbi:MAG TPA: DUF421 domain-containing protein [Chondromyces sp.]|nr:DUF421 domain-containing protein [Chondromyces sp.]